MIFVDSNVPMYLVGAPHPHKADSQRLLERCVAQQERLVTDAEVLQEILHRYAAIARRDAIAAAFEALLSVVDEAFPIELADRVAGQGRPASDSMKPEDRWLPPIMPSPP